MACGGNSEKKQAGPKTIAEQYNEWMEKISEDYGTYYEKYNEWYDSLTDEQKKEVEAAEKEAVKKFQEEMEQFDKELEAAREMGMGF